MAAGDESSEIRLVRVYDAPIDAVWEAWTVPEQVAQWWGPRGFTLTTHSRDLRTGGHWHYTMHGPDGTDYENTTQYLEVVPRERLVYDHGGHADRPPLFRVTVRFSESRGRTRMEMISKFASPQIMREMRGVIRKAGGEGTWDRLAEHLGKVRDERDRFFMARSFDAPLERMYALCTDPALIAQWLPPTGATMRFLRADVRPGGSSFYEMPHPNGSTLYGLIKYLALEPPHRIVYTQQFCDAGERLIRAPFFAHWPETMLTTLELAEEGADQTRLVVRWEPLDATAEEIAEFVEQRGGMAMGWGGSFGKLEALVGG